MAKHSKPTRTSALSKTGARGAAALAIASVGFLATAPAALADADNDVEYESNNLDTPEPSTDGLGGLSGTELPQNEDILGGLDALGGLEALGR